MLESSEQRPRGSAWEAGAGFVDADGLVARATGVNGPGAPASPASLASVGVALPGAVVDSESIARSLGVHADWIVSRTGVRERRVAVGESLVDLAAAAGERALSLAGVEAADLDLVLVATFTADDLQPHAAPLIADRLGARSAGAIDVGAACTGFLSGLALASAQLESGRAGSVLVIGADLVSRVVDYSDRRTAGLFGDGAGAAVLTPGGPGSVGEIVLRADGGRADLIRASHEERKLRMDGRATFRAATAALAEVTREVASDAGLTLAEIDLFVYHQANARIISSVGERLGLPAERIVDCIDRYGNTSAASIPIALAEASADGRLARGSRVLLAAFGAGITWGGGLIEWGGRA